MNVDNQPFRILLIDDTASIHDDFRKVFASEDNASSIAALADLESQLFGTAPAVMPVSAASDATRFEIDSAMQGQEGVEKLRIALAEGRPYAMAFVDMRMPPGWDGVDTIRELWKLEPTLQVAICTAYSDYTPDEVASELKLDGRMLIIRKPFDKAEIRQLAAVLCDRWQVNRRKMELEGIVEQRTAELTRATMHDALTGLPNRVLFADRLKQTLGRSLRTQDHTFAVLYIDVDEFKLVNDGLGHEFGDLLLQQVAERINKSVRDIDTVARVDETKLSGDRVAARLGGDEFAVILENVGGAEGAAQVAQRLLDAGGVPYEINGRQVRCTFSIGVATSTLSYSNHEDMLRDADTAMYHAKHEGRGRFVMFDQAMRDIAIARMSFEADLRHAIDSGQIQVHYQPIVDMDTQQVVGFEALARWEHATRGWISPVDFIPVAEKTGMIIPLGLGVLKKAAAQLAQWQLSPENKGLTVSVNLSRKQLTYPRIVDDIAAVLASSGVQPRTLKIEITESCVMADPRAAVAVLKRIQALDVPLHIDDFGTGYSSLSCLQTFPINGLKVDRSFVKQISECRDQAALLGAIVTLAHSMNVPLVSEGIETTAQAALLQRMGCDFGQGYLFAKAMDAASATQFITASAAAKRAA